eukprot:NODE_572_length_1538_cov_89.578912_g417_i1.p1 GENE.NODE_572_length_1538_cov_89.578912_g417_i1~~NODE_572_length_1538_cov_89.578912_g417_i1.p1  ORF type:complete len:414 (+),score=83.06 NODE_572_length_1538_cov_89.578912_g417_i1:132-1373(+)
MPTVTYHVPAKVTLDALSDFVNLHLKLPQEQSFNFLLDDEFITTNVLAQFMLRKKISKEATLDLEYTPAFQIEAGLNMPHDDWVPTICRLPIPHTPGSDPSLHPYLTGSYDRCVRIWKGTECLHVSGGHTNAIKQAAILTASEGEVGQGKRKRDAVQCSFVTGSSDGTIRLWKYYNGSMSEQYCFTHPDALDTIALHPTNSLVASGGWDKLVRVWALDKVIEDGCKGGREYLQSTLLGHSRAILATAWSQKSAERLFSTGLDGAVRVWDVQQGAPLMKLSGNNSAAYCMATAPGDVILSGHTDNKVRLWDTRTPKTNQIFNGHKGWIFDVTWNHLAGGTAGNEFCTASEDGSVGVWDIRSTGPLGMMQHHTDGVLSVCWLGNGIILSGSKDNTVRSCSVNHKTVLEADSTVAV